MWYSIQSVINYVDEIIVWDTGSNDSTRQIIDSIASPKIKTFFSTQVDPSSFTDIRQKALQMVSSEWFMMLDGDEIWPEESIAKTVSYIKQTKNDTEYLIHPHYNLVGDIYHYQDSSAGKYKLGPHRGMVNIRFINLQALPKLHFAKPHGQQGLYDGTDTLIQDRIPPKGQFLDLPFLHLTHLRRSRADSKVMKRGFKYKYELGHSFPDSFVYPKSFYLPRPNIVPDPWHKAELSYLIVSAALTPLKKLKRFFYKGPDGY